jgi:hypothetical protein
MYETLKSIYQRDTTQQKSHLLQEFHNYKFDNKKDMMKNISGIQNLAHKLNQMKQQVDDEMIIPRIMTVLPKEYKYFSSARDSTSSIDRTLDNLIKRLSLEEMKTKKILEAEEEAVAFKATTKQRGKTLKCYICKKTGHVQANCFYKDKYCQICKKTNHPKKDYYFKDKIKEENKKAHRICNKTNHEEKDCFYRDRSK